jgi:SAM-dependent methyltransferase
MYKSDRLNRHVQVGSAELIEDQLCRYDQIYHSYVFRGRFDRHDLPPPSTNSKESTMAQSSPPTESLYIHGSTPPEQNRLSLLNDLMNQAALRELAIEPGTSILDVGSGLGQLTRGMARASGVGVRVVGIERDASQLDRARILSAQAGESSLVEFRQGDATLLPLSDVEFGAFDLCHSRFVLEHVPDPAIVVRQMVKATRPGGRVVLQDDDHDVMRVWPEPEGFVSLWQAYMESYRRLGNDPLVGRRLVQLLADAGLGPTRNTWLFFGSCQGQENFEPLVANLMGVLDGARELMLSLELIDIYQFQSSMAALEAWKGRQDASFWYAICYAEARK